MSFAAYQAPDIPPAATKPRRGAAGHSKMSGDMLVPGMAAAAPDKGSLCCVRLYGMYASMCEWRHASVCCMRLFESMGVDFCP